MIRGFGLRDTATDGPDADVRLAVHTLAVPK
jgi:hypothetical protein